MLVAPAARSFLGVSAYLLSSPATRHHLTPPSSLSLGAGTLLLRRLAPPRRSVSSSSSSVLVAPLSSYARGNGSGGGGDESSGRGGGGGGRGGATGAKKRNRDAVGRDRYKGRGGGGGQGEGGGGGRGVGDDDEWRGSGPQEPRSRGGPRGRGGGGRRSDGGGRRGGGGRGGRGPRRSDDEGTRRPEPFVPAPPPPRTVPGGPRPTYYTCRHNYEETLMREIERAAAAGPEGGDGAAAKCSSPYPGLVRVVQDGGGDATALLPLGARHDPVYALQALPDAVVVESESIKGLAREVVAALLGPPQQSSNKDDGDDGESPDAAVDERAAAARAALRSAQRGSLAVHALVPGMLRGQPDPVMKRRADRVAEEAGTMLKRGYAAARAAKKKTAASAADGDGTGGSVSDVDEDDDGAGERWVLQILLLSPEVAAASLARCESPWDGNTANAGGLPSMSWPSWDLPAGLANVDIEDRMPSSAYRKLLEAFRCLRRRPLSLAPSSAATSSLRYEPPPPADDAAAWVIDLGACPGGWTAALRQMGCAVIAVDRTEVDSALMADENVQFVKGDAFTYEPPWAETRRGATTAPDNSWMVSDVIAYPERVTEMLGRWCGGRWVQNLIVTVKFQGAEPAWDELDEALEAGRRCGYDCRAKHFFNNKNEVTLMASERGAAAKSSFGGMAMGGSGQGKDDGFLGRSMYPRSLPAHR